MVRSSKVLSNLEANRSINPSLELARMNFDAKKRLQTANHNNIMRELKRKRQSTTAELLRYNQECAQTKINYESTVKKISEKKQMGYIIVNYNDSMLFDLSTMQELDRKKVYKKYSTGKEILRDDLTIIGQNMNLEDNDKFSSTISKNLLYLREIAYLYFKNSKKASISGFKSLIAGLSKRTKEEYITEDSLHKLYNYLGKKGIMDIYDINPTINDMFKVTEKVYEKRINNEN